MAKSYRPSRGNWDRRDGLRINRLNDNRMVSRYTHSISLWDADNIVQDNEDGNGYHHISIAKELRRCNSGKCRKVNGYNGKLNGRM